MQDEMRSSIVKCWAGYRMPVDIASGKKCEIFDSVYKTTPLLNPLILGTKNSPYTQRYTVFMYWHIAHDVCEVSVCEWQMTGVVGVWMPWPGGTMKITM